jgi:hypothetical protein
MMENLTQKVLQESEGLVYASLLRFLRSAIKLRHGDFKELSDVYLSIVNFVDAVEKRMGKQWLDGHLGVTVDSYMTLFAELTGLGMHYCSQYCGVTCSPEYFKCIEEHRDDIIHEFHREGNPSETEDVITSLYFDIKEWGLDKLSFEELQTLAKVIEDVVGYYRKHGYGADDKINEVIDNIHVRQ